MGGILKLFGLLMALFLSLSTLAASSTEKKLQLYLNEINLQKKTLAPLPSPKSDKDPQIVIHFLWTSWCEYCDKAYTSLMEFKKTPEIQGKVQFIGYCLDENISQAVKIKLKEMAVIEHFHAPYAKIKSPEEMNRLPAIMVENKKTGEVSAYTGFTNERFHYMEKSVLRELSASSGDPNEQH
jgi:thiol-disulfide isomerase/thioredoxin